MNWILFFFRVFVSNYEEALIIFDVMGFIHNFGKSSHIEVNVGGRQHIYLKTFSNFASRLKSAGAKLVFICDGHLRPDRISEWCIRRESEFRKAYAMLTGHSHLQSKYSFGCKSIVSSLFKLIEDNELGEIMISTHAECDAIVASYAYKHNALAVVGDDSDFLIYEGSFAWWQSASLNMNHCTVRSFDRFKLRRYLNLNNTQMKYLATLAGNDHTKHIVQQQTGEFRNMTNFMMLASFCRSLTTGTNEAVACQQIATYMRSQQRKLQSSDLECIRKSIDSYSIEVEQTTATDRLELFYRKSYLHMH